MSKVIFFFIILFLGSCIDKNFIIYSIDGEKLRYDDLYRRKSIISDFKLYFNKNEIDKDYTELHYVVTDYYYYGQFYFFDENFMAMLKNKTLRIGADALIYEKDRTDFPEYDKNYLYFTAIKYKN